MLDRRDQDRIGPFLLLIGIALSAFAGAAVKDGHRSLQARTSAVPIIAPENAFIGIGEPITMISRSGGDLLIAEQIDRSMKEVGGKQILIAEPEVVHASRSLSIPLAMQWRHPKAGLPAAQIVRAAERDALGRIGPVITRSYLFNDHGQLPVISITSDHNGLFSPDSGLLVVGNAIMQATPRAAASYGRDPRWWKYPGNFMGRGKEWERAAQIEMILPDGDRATVADAKIRVHGQMTRGFPQHALRLIFDDPIDPWNSIGKGRGYHSMVLRAAGNDQVKAMMRDAFQQTLCAGLPFGTSRAWPCVVYINGAYWGVHHLRERIDEDELARRYSIPAKEITILEDAAVLYRGDAAQVAEFNRMLKQAEKGMDMDLVEAELDVDGFLTYMASQMILGNMDWPEQNVKYWRFTGEKGEGFRDGRWYFIMGDSDLSFGSNAAPGSDMFIRVRNSNAPIARLFKALMRDQKVQARFNAVVDELISGPLSGEKMLAGIDRMVQLLGPEMDRHTARWRKPLNKDAWEQEVEVMRNFARTRARSIREQIGKNDLPGSS